MEVIQKHLLQVYQGLRFLTDTECGRNIFKTILILDARKMHEMCECVGSPVKSALQLYYHISMC